MGEVKLVNYDGDGEDRRREEGGSFLALESKIRILSLLPSPPASSDWVARLKYLNLLEFSHLVFWDHPESLQLLRDFGWIVRLNENQQQNKNITPH